MFQSRAIAAESKTELYRELAQQLEALLAGDRDPVANAANTAALLYHALPDVNWAGFYFLRENGELVLGPFQGKPACVRIGAGQGVCGAATLRREPVVVQDVAAFPGHIACDTDSRSELVVPLIAKDRVIGVLDLDSPRTHRFDADDETGIVRAAEIYIRATYG
ncbi:MAG TPA: GAF domain-containing protein [Rhizomicrobium sp.]